MPELKPQGKAKPSSRGPVEKTEQMYTVSSGWRGKKRYKLVRRDTHASGQLKQRLAGGGPYKKGMFDFEPGVWVMVQKTSRGKKAE